jgi:hypothetical protein
VFHELGQVRHDDLAVGQREVVQRDVADVRDDVELQDPLIAHDVVLGLHVVAEPAVQLAGGPLLGEVGERGDAIPRLLGAPGAERIDGAGDRVPLAPDAGTPRHPEQLGGRRGLAGLPEARGDARERGGALDRLRPRRAVREGEELPLAPLEGDARGEPAARELVELSVAAARHGYFVPFVAARFLAAGFFLADFFRGFRAGFTNASSAFMIPRDMTSSTSVSALTRSA